MTEKLPRQPIINVANYVVNMTNIMKSDKIKQEINLTKYDLCQVLFLLQRHCLKRYHAHFIDAGFYSRFKEKELIKPVNNDILESYYHLGPAYIDGPISYLVVDESNVASIVEPNVDWSLYSDSFKQDIDTFLLRTLQQKTYKDVDYSRLIEV